jgi:prephenate dehydrogenase
MTFDTPGFLGSKHIAIFGLGLMGGSLAMALKGYCRKLTGIDPDPAVIGSAKSRGIVDQADVRAGNMLSDVDLIILAAPVNTILNLLVELPALTSHPSIVMDFGSTKELICHAMQSLPANFDPIGGHPMCGKESSSLENADPAIFQDAAFALVPLTRTSQSTKETAISLANLLGSHPVWLDATTHDRQVAATSHLPYLVANVLAFCTPTDTAEMAASGFASSTRLAITSPIMMMDVLQTNRTAILAALGQFQEHLYVVENLLTAGNFETLQSLLAQGAENRNQIVRISTGELS